MYTVHAYLPGSFTFFVTNSEGERGFILDAERFEPSFEPVLGILGKYGFVLVPDVVVDKVSDFTRLVTDYVYEHLASYSDAFDYEF